VKPRNAENRGAQKNLNVAILAPLYHAPDRAHRPHRGSVIQRKTYV
jgi:hypothetical protein